MDLETKIKQSVIILSAAIGIGLFTKYTGIDDAIMPNTKKQEIRTEQTYEKKEEHKEIKKNKEITHTISKQKNIETKKHTYNNEIKQEDNTKDFPIIHSTNLEKKVFIYHQNLSSDEMMNEAMEVTDYWMPHFYEIKQEKIGYDKKHKKNITHTIFQNRASDRFLKKVIKNAKTKDITNIMPMVSAFEKKSVMSVLNNPKGYAKRIYNEIKKVSANGISIDLESIDVGKEESGKLINFMKILRKEMPGYIITIAVSPRFVGSAEKGFKHHGFYDYKELAKYVDYMNIMFYDFHKDKEGPIAPAHLNDQVSKYALENIPPEKIVMLYPLYGNVWEHTWKKNKEIIKSLGPLGSNKVDTFIQGRDVLYKYYEDGELVIKTPDRTAYVQDGTTYYNRTKRMDKFGLTNLGGWKQNHGTKDIYNQIKYWKQRK